MKYKIGVYGSNIQESTQAVQLAQTVGRLLAQREVVVITGACSGMPYIFAQAAKQQGAEIWGFRPERDVEAQKRAFPSDDMAVYDTLFFIPPSYDQQFFLDHSLQEGNDRGVRLRYRNFLSTLHADAAILLAGGWGTLNEFTHLLSDGKSGTRSFARNPRVLYSAQRSQKRSLPMCFSTVLCFDCSAPDKFEGGRRSFLAGSHA
ncbi:MAG TPA: hypothetical protein VFV38_41145 [Ktedonobacteraceae bacterium]|nr:hypothetical protein [Ktedonobacteraceae bacterium]